MATTEPHRIRITKIEDDDIEWEALTCPTALHDGLWRQCIEPTCDVNPYDKLTEAEVALAEDDQLEVHGKPHGIRDGSLALIDLRECELNMDGVIDSINEYLHTEDSHRGPREVKVGDTFIVESEWDGDWWWASLTKEEAA